MPKGLKGFQKGHPQFKGAYKFPQGHIPWNKGKSWVNLKKRTGEDRECLYCNQFFYSPGWLIVNGGGKYCSHNCYGKSKKNKKPWNFKGIFPIRERIRKTRKYKKFQKSILKRDDYTCQKCDTRGSKLHVDHIKPFALFPKLRYEKSNCQTLCPTCHNKKTALDWKLYPMWHGGIYEGDILGR